MASRSWSLLRKVPPASLLVTAFCLIAADWPQFLGPTRNGISSETGLRTEWPKSGPPVLWHKEVGDGYSGPVVAGQRLVLFHRLEDKEVLSCFDAVTGADRWSTSFPTQYRDDYGKGDGPRSTPLLTGNRVYALGAEGRLICLELDSGQKVWERSLLNDYEVPKSFFGVATSPLLAGNLLLVNVGGKSAGIVAFDKDTGKEVWKAGTDQASYSSPILATLNGTPEAIFFTREGIVFLDPHTGAVHYKKRWRARIHASVNAATPLVVDDYVFISASYGTGAILLQTRKDGVAEIWKNDLSMSNHYSTCIPYKGYLYGYDGRQDEGAARLRCVELQTGKVAWTADKPGCGFMVLADGHLIILEEDGDLVLVEPTPEAYREKARVSVLGSPSRSPLALANGRLYARDPKKLICLSLQK
jgi:outer membrane protein assembly factor BamB